jgi:hypothetical protein
LRDLLRAAAGLLVFFEGELKLSRNAYHRYGLLVGENDIDYPDHFLDEPVLADEVLAAQIWREVLAVDVVPNRVEEEANEVLERRLELLQLGELGAVGRVAARFEEVLGDLLDDEDVAVDHAQELDRVLVFPDVEPVKAVDLETILVVD